MSDRPETGPMRFNGDWSGVFIRGDDAFGYARSLEVLLDNKADEFSTTIARLVLAGLLQNLNASDERNMSVTQEMGPFRECLDAPP